MNHKLIAAIEATRESGEAVKLLESFTPEERQTLAKFFGLSEEEQDRLEQLFDNFLAAKVSLYDYLAEIPKREEYEVLLHTLCFLGWNHNGIEGGIMDIRAFHGYLEACSDAKELWEIINNLPADVQTRLGDRWVIVR